MFHFPNIWIIFWSVTEDQYFCHRYATFLQRIFYYSLAFPYSKVFATFAKIWTENHVGIGCFFDLRFFDWLSNVDAKKIFAKIFAHSFFPTVSKGIRENVLFTSLISFLFIWSFSILYTKLYFKCLLKRLHDSNVEELKQYFLAYDLSLLWF